MRLFPLLVFGAFAVHAQTARGLGDLTGNWWLALDGRVWESRGTAELRFHSFEKYSGNPVLTADRPWEGDLAYLYGTVLPEENGDGLRMWYHAYVDDARLMPGKHRYTNLYATSRDGFHWTKPALGAHAFQGSTENNIVLMRPTGPGESHSPNVIHTPWEKDPAQRYKMVTYVYYDGYYGATSPDGIHWTDVPRNPILEDPGDVGNFVWDARRRSYIGYPKVFSEVRGFRRRCVGFSETREFERWPRARLILAPDDEDDRGMFAPDARTEFYGLSAFPYQNLYVGFLWIYRLERGDERIWPELVYSGDGVEWNRIPAPRLPVLPLGAAGAWDDGMIFTPNHPLIRGEKLQLYYGGFDGPHNSRTRRGAIGLATMRRDGFASFTAGDIEAAVVTAPISGHSGALLVNAAAPGGEIRAEVLDKRGNPIPGYEKVKCEPFKGDSTKHQIRWNENARLPQGDTIRIRFWLRGASLYSFFAGDGAVQSNTAAANSLE
jgi:hypothetical protein